MTRRPRTCLQNRRWMQPKPPWPPPGSTRDASEADNQRVRRMHNYTTVQAPISGRCGVALCGYRRTDPGRHQFQQPGSAHRAPLAELACCVCASRFPRAMCASSTTATNCKVRVDAIGRSLTGKIVRFTRDVNFETRTMETEVDVQNEDLSISPGMYANTMLRLGHVAERGHYSHRSAGAQRRQRRWCMCVD